MENFQHQQHLIIDLLNDLDFKALADDAKECQNNEVLFGYARLIEIEAKKLEKHDVLERLQFAGLMYA